MIEHADNGERVLRALLAAIALGYVGALLVSQWRRVREAIDEVARLARKGER